MTLNIVAFENDFLIDRDPRLGGHRPGSWQRSSFLAAAIMRLRSRSRPQTTVRRLRMFAGSGMLAREGGRARCFSSLGTNTTATDRSERKIGELKGLAASVVTETFVEMWASFANLSFNEISRMVDA